ncbi:hypothetical protein Q7L73_09430, partial [Conexibacter sp. CPCC 205762]|nr:hypothetical protein [Conexibacter sp. CPCC 205762]
MDDRLPNLVPPVGPAARRRRLRAGLLGIAAALTFGAAPAAALAADAPQQPAPAAAAAPAEQPAAAAAPAEQPAP